MATALTNMGTVLASVVDIIEDNAILMTMFAGGLLVVGAKVFKRIKKSARA